jgi:hypothetical protein
MAQGDDGAGFEAPDAEDLTATRAVAASHIALLEARTIAARAVLAARAADQRALRISNDLDEAYRTLAVAASRSRDEKAARLALEIRANAPLLAPPRASSALGWSDYRDVAIIRASNLFDAAFYAAQLPLRASVGDLVEHYVGQGWRQGLDPGPYFHTRFYLQSYPDVAADGRCPLAHYIRTGARELRSPHPLFDAAWYADLHNEVRASGLAPLEHYRREGARQLFDPHPMFSVRFYLDRHDDLAGSQDRAFDHFLTAGGPEGRTPHPMFDAEFYRAAYAPLGSRERNLLIDFLMAPAAEARRPHGAFDSAWYRAQNPDARGPNIVAAVHYLKHGAARASWPCPLFDPNWYAGELKGEPADEGLFFHYLTKGWRAGRRPHPLFDPVHYDSQASHTGMEPLAHFLTKGGFAGLAPHAAFDTAWYQRTNPHLAAEGRIPLLHYLEEGSRAGCNPNPVFDAAYYRATYDDVRDASLEPLSHYCISGEPEGRKPALLFDPKFLRAGGGPARTLEQYFKHGAASGSTHYMFDPGFYRARYADVASSPLDPLGHFIHVGAAELRDPHPLFEAAWYAARYLSEAKGGRDPVTDYLTEGWKHNKQPSRLFDPIWYRDACRARGEEIGEIDPLEHFATIGQALEINPHPLFDVSWYLSKNPEARDYPGGALGHFQVVGALFNLSPNALFNAAWYTSEYKVPEGLSAFHHYMDGGARALARPTPLFDPHWYTSVGADTPPPQDALAHYIHRGEREGRRPNPYFDPVAYNMRRAQRASQTQQNKYAPAETFAWRKDAPLGAPGSRIYVSVLAFEGDLKRAHALATALKAHDRNITIRLTLLDAPTRALSSAEDVLDEVRDLSSLNMPKLNAWLFGLTRAQAPDAVQMLVLRDLMARPDARAVVCAPVDVDVASCLDALLSPLVGAAATVPYSALRAQAPLFAVKPSIAGELFAKYLRDALAAGESIATALVEAPLELSAVHVVNVTLPATHSGNCPNAWTYDTFRNGAAITDGHRSLYRNAPTLQDRFPDPYATDNDGGFYGCSAEDGSWRGTPAASTFRHDTALAHYIEFGRAMRIAPSSQFDSGAYRGRYPDVGQDGHDPFEHYVLYGAREGRDASAPS